MLKKLNPEIALGFLLATIVWIGVLGWSLSYTPPEIEKQTCYETARKTGHKAEECKTLWERTTSDPVAFFTFVLSISTIALFATTVALWRVTRKSADVAERALTDLERPYIYLHEIKTDIGVFFNPNTVIREDQGPYFQFSVINYGRTPGNMARAMIQFRRFGSYSGRTERR